MAEAEIRLLRLTWRRFLWAVRNLLSSDRANRAVTFASLLAVGILLINALNVLNSFVGRDFMSAIQARDFTVFWQKAFLYALVFILSTLAATLFRFFEERLGLLWREQLTWYFIDNYLQNRTYLLMGAEGVANPDQRITEDVRAFTSTTLSFVLMFCNAFITVISFSGVLWSISPLLFAVAITYAAMGSLITALLGRPLIRLNYAQLDLEANLRSDLIHLRENADSIALARREGRFRTRLHGRLQDVVNNLRRIIAVNRNLSFFTNGYNYFIQLVPVLVIAPMFMRGEVEFGVVTQSMMAFSTLMGAFSLIVTQFQSISAFTAVTTRIHLLSEAMEKTVASAPLDIFF
ncbi:MAG: ABC transporter transmembrane domain-containing protein, partial [Chthoniobacterales bacterium]|nr:ABC transporter transmembrane domain-containing protein [Chthoniobacterales bacterium]